MKHTAELHFPPELTDYLRRVLLSEERVPGCEIREVDGGLLIEAEDLSRLRAALNSYIRWLHIALEIRKNVLKEGSK
jgi:cytochrome c